MFDYILEQYKNDIYNKNNYRNIKELKKQEKVMFGVLIMCMIGTLIATLIGKTIFIILFSGAILLDILFLKNSSDNRFKKNNIDIMKMYENVKVKRIVNMLKDESIDMYKVEEIKWIISMCERVCNENDKKEFYAPVTAFFTTIILPILAATAALVVKDMETIDVLKLAILAIGLSTILFANTRILIPVIEHYINKKKRLAETLKEDLEFILLKYDNYFSDRK